MAATRYDLVVLGGRLIDPARGIDAPRDVAVRDGRVAAVAERLEPALARESLDARGLLVLPGLIDLHVHVFWGGSHYGIDVDRTCLAYGVTTVLDAGTAGAVTFPAFRRYIIDVAAARVYALLNLSAAGMLHDDIGELEDLRWADEPLFLRTFEAHRDRILGVKVRLQRRFVGAHGREALAMARRLADRIGRPLMIHPGDTEPTCEEILDHMVAGDLLTHCYHSRPDGVLDETGRVRPAVRAAVNRGVLLDVGHGQGSFAWRVAEQAFNQDLLPSTISSDLHRHNVEGPVFDLLTTVSKFVHLGLPLAEALRRVTAVPAAAIGQEGRLGTLAVGAEADLALAEWVAEPVDLVDAEGQVRRAAGRLVPRGVLRAGRPYTPDPTVPLYPGHRSHG